MLCTIYSCFSPVQKSFLLQITISPLFIKKKNLIQWSYHISSSLFIWEQSDWPATLHSCINTSVQSWSLLFSFFIYNIKTCKHSNTLLSVCSYGNTHSSQVIHRLLSIVFSGDTRLLNVNYKSLLTKILWWYASNSLLNKDLYYWDWCCPHYGSNNWIQHETFLLISPVRKMTCTLKK